MVDMKALAAYHTSDAAKRSLRRRHRAEARFRFMGLMAVAAAAAALAALCWTIGVKAVNAVYEYGAVVDVRFPADAFDPDKAIKPYERPLIEQGVLSASSILRRAARAQIGRALDAALFARLTNVTDDTREAARELLTDGNVDVIHARVERGEIGPGARLDGFTAELSDDAQLYFKGAYGAVAERPTLGALAVSGFSGAVEIRAAADDFARPLRLLKATLSRAAERLRRQETRQANAVAVTQARLAELAPDAQPRAEAEAALARFAAERDRLAAEAAALEARVAAAEGVEPLTEDGPSVLVFVNGGVVKLTAIGPGRATGVTLAPLADAAPAAPGAWRLGVLETPEAVRRLKDVQIVWLEELKRDAHVSASVDFGFVTDTDSRQAELAGIWAALVGTFWTMLVTFALAFPIGVMAAIYLEEFAPRNGFTDFIEVNINNLAAIPSIIFGLFGLLLLLSGFEVPLGGGVSITIGGWFSGYRSAAFVGGTVLALMTLPTIIIAARASIRAVPPSIRAAALGVGASKVQSVFHHVLPLAMPGILTGSIIGMAQALGETAPILMVGMVGFFVEPARSVTDPTTVMPAIIYFWSDYPERLFEFKTAMAIVALLLFLVAMNTLAVLLRRRFERRW